MKNFFYVILLVSMIHLQAEVVSELGSYERSEEINGTIFKCKLFFDDDEIIKDFFVDNERVNEEVYHTRKHEAYEKELVEAQDQLKKLYQTQDAVYCTLRSKGYLKLIKEIKQKIEAVLSMLDDPSLKNFLVFSENAGVSREYLQHIQDQFLPSLQFIDDPDACQEESVKLKKLFDLSEEIYAMLMQFYKESVERAIEKADDPTDLKKLLELI